MDPGVSMDEDVNDYFDMIVVSLSLSFGYCVSQSEDLVREYHRKFTDPIFCSSIGIGVQDEDFFFHEGVLGMALRIQYYLVLKGSPRRDAFIDWRKEFVAARKRG